MSGKRTRRWLVFVLWLSWTATGFARQDPAQIGSSQIRAAAIQVQSSLVLVDVITKDATSGLPARDLRQSDFRVFDDGQQVPITTFDTGTDARPMGIWLVVICNEREKVGGSANYAGKEQLFRSAFDYLSSRDKVGVAHWCDNGETRLDLLPTEDRELPLRVLADTIQPISFSWSPEADPVGEVTFRKMLRLIIQDAHRKNPQPLPEIVFLDGDHTGQPRRELHDLVNDFLETSGVAFGIKDHLYPHVPRSFIGERAEILRYMAEQTGAQYFTVPPSDYAATLEAILDQLHFRYQLGFVPPAIDDQRHKLKVELAKDARARHKGLRLRFRTEYIPVREAPDWAR